MYVAFSGLGLIISFFVGSRHLSKEHEEFKTGLDNMNAARRREAAEERTTGKYVVTDEEKPGGLPDASGSDVEPGKEALGKKKKTKRFGMF